MRGDFACGRAWMVSSCGAITEPPREGRTLGAIALVGASACSTNTERQRAAQGTVSCPLPAPDGYNLAPWWLPRKTNGGSGGRRHKNTECFSRRRPPVALCLLCRRGQSRSPAGETIPHPLNFLSPSLPKFSTVKCGMFVDKSGKLPFIFLRVESDKIPPQCLWTLFPLQL